MPTIERVFEIGVVQEQGKDTILKLIDRPSEFPNFQRFPARVELRGGVGRVPRRAQLFLGAQASYSGRFTDLSDYASFVSELGKIQGYLNREAVASVGGSPPLEVPDIFDVDFRPQSLYDLVKLLGDNTKVKEYETPK